MCSVWMAVEFTFLPDPVDIGFIGIGSSVGAVFGGAWAFFLGYSLDEIATHAAGAAVALGACAGVLWLLGLGGLELVS
jgi:hypothetical protein